MLTQLYRRFALFQWVLVYTLEAHAVDEWPISSSRADPSGNPVHIQQHRSLQERLSAARSFSDVFEVPFPVVIDSMDNSFEALFCTWPFRFYVLQHGHVAFQAQPKECTYILASLAKALEGIAV